jgi:hypothetical protein
VIPVPRVVSPLAPETWRSGLLVGRWIYFRWMVHERLKGPMQRERPRSWGIWHFLILVHIQIGPKVPWQSLYRGSFGPHLASCKGQDGEGRMLFVFWANWHSFCAPFLSCHRSILAGILERVVQHGRFQVISANTIVRGHFKSGARVRKGSPQIDLRGSRFYKRCRI